MDSQKTLYGTRLTRKKLGQVCLEAFENPDDEFGKTVINILEREYGKSSLKESLKVRPLSANVYKIKFNIFNLLSIELEIPLDFNDSELNSAGSKSQTITNLHPYCVPLALWR